MAGFSYHERYDGSEYKFPWGERSRWHRLIQRFHPHGTQTWTIRRKVKGKDEKEERSLPGPLNMEQLYNAQPHGTTCRVVVRGNGFWGTMPQRLNWSALSKLLPTGRPPPHVDKFYDLLKSAAGMVGCHYDRASIVDTTAFEAMPVPVEWFPLLIARLREKMMVTSLFYAPSTQAVYLKLVSAKQRNDEMIVRFTPTVIQYAADPIFDLDQGFEPNVAPAEMHADFAVWDHKPRSELLRLRAPFDMLAVNLET